MLATPDTMPEARRYGTQEPPPGVAAGRPLGAQLAMLRGEGPNLPTPTASSNERGSKTRHGGPSIGMVLRVCEAPDHNAGDLLPTPTAWEQRSDPDEDGRNLLPLAVQRIGRDGLLPTPAVNDMGAGKDPEEFTEWRYRQKSAAGDPATHGRSLDVEARLLPTPKASNNENRPSEGYQAGVGYAIQHSGWGQYAPAIAQWEAILGRPAPSPTVPEGKNGEPRLNPELTEFMMGLPAGWVCDVPGLSRNAKLKACGNGVVPQQAAFALRVMVTEESAS